jgi:leucyl aminopeptidase
MDHFVARATPKTIPIIALRRAELKNWLKGQSKLTRGWVKTRGFKAKRGAILMIPGREGTLARVLLGLGKGAMDPWVFAGLPGRLPNGRYQLDGKWSQEDANVAALGWGLACYRFRRFKSGPPAKLPKLVWPEPCDQPAVQAAVEASVMVRDLINTPAGDLGPGDLVEEVRKLADRHEADFESIEGEGLLEEGYPTIHAVGRAADRPPALADLRWGDENHPRVTLVGKGVVFDSGGLNLKSTGGMRLMKKDMGGAASVLGLAHMIMSAGLPVRLRVLIPTVENAVSGDAYRPLDVIKTRKGVTVEVGNTDAEGRLILCDALAEADSEAPALLIDFATLTGAARVALGTELPALFCNDDALADETLAAGRATHDQLWRMPLHDPYRRHLDSRVADLNNIAGVSHGGAITAALFLREFISSGRKWIHVDTMGWNAASRPGRPIGGEAMGVRAMFSMLAARFPHASTD